MMERFRRAMAPPLAAGLLLVSQTACNSGPAGSDDTGEWVVWRAPLQSDRDPIGIPATDGSRIFSAVSGVSAYATADGSLVWRSPLAAYSPENVVTDGQRVYAAERVAHAFDPANGHELWQFTPDDNASLGRSAVAGGVFYFGTASHRVYALNAATGQELWHTDVGPEWTYSSVVRGIAVSGDTVYAAAEQWRAQNGYIATAWLIALDRATGRVLWRFSSGTANDRHTFTTLPVVAGRLVVLTDVSNNSVVAVDRFTGQQAWEYLGLRGYVGFLSSPVVDRETVYAASADTYVYALNLQTGELRWKTATPAGNRAISLCGGRLFVNYQGVQILDAASGRTLWRGLDSESDFTVSEFAVRGDRVYVLGNKAVYALRC